MTSNASIPSFPSRSLLLAATFATLSACSGVHAMRPVTTPIRYEADASDATVIFLRSSRRGSAITFRVVDAEGRFIAATKGRMHAVARVPAGENTFYLISENTDLVRATLRPGRTYVVETRPRMGWGKARVSALAVRRDTDEWSELGELLEDTDAWVPEPAEGSAWAQQHAENVRSRMTSADEEWTSEDDEWRQEHTLGADDGLSAEEVQALFRDDG